MIWMLITSLACSLGATAIVAIVWRLEADDR